MKLSKNWLLIVTISLTTLIDAAQQDPKKRTQNAGNNTNTTKTSDKKRPTRRRSNTEQQRKKSPERQKTTQKANDVDGLRNIQAKIDYYAVMGDQIYDVAEETEGNFADLVTYVTKKLNIMNKDFKGYHEENQIRRMAKNSPDQLAKLFSDNMIDRYNGFKDEFGDEPGFVPLTNKLKNDMIAAAKKAIEMFRKTIK